MNPFEFFFDCRKRGEATGSQITWIGWVGVTCRTYRVRQANMLKPDVCELNNGLDESPVVIDAAFFIEERLPTRME
jgi:hypothetical protein